MTPSQYISPIQSNDSTDIGTEAGAIVLRYILNVVYRRYCSPHQPGEHGQSGLASPVPVHSRFNQVDTLYLNCRLGRNIFESNGRLALIHNPIGPGYALPSTGTTGNGIRGRSRLYFDGKESDTIPWRKTPLWSGSPSAFTGDVDQPSPIYITPCISGGNGHAAVLECDIKFGHLW